MVQVLSTTEGHPDHTRLRLDVDLYASSSGRKRVTFVSTAVVERI